MLNDAVSIANTLVGRMIFGLVALALDHPFVLTCILAILMGATVAVLLDAIGPRHRAAEAEGAPPARASRS